MADAEVDWFFGGGGGDALGIFDGGCGGGKKHR